MTNNKQQKKEETFTNSFWGWFFVSYLLICLIYTSSVIIPIIFFLWILNGWNISNFISHNFILGSNSVKKCFNIFTFLGVLGLLLLISVI
jgi:hypothetical protein